MLLTRGQLGLKCSYLFLAAGCSFSALVPGKLRPLSSFPTVTSVFFACETGSWESSPFLVPFGVLSWLCRGARRHSVLQEMGMQPGRGPILMSAALPLPARLARPVPVWGLWYTSLSAGRRNEWTKLGWASCIQVKAMLSGPQFFDLYIRERGWTLSQHSVLFGEKRHQVDASPEMRE